MAPFRAASEARTYTIGDLADLFRISRRTLRFYEERELLRPRRDGRRRVYSEDDRTRLDIIVGAKRLGFSLSAIWDLIERRSSGNGTEILPKGLALSQDEIESQVAWLTKERDRVDRAIEELRAAAARHDLTSDEPPRTPGPDAQGIRGRFP